MNDLPLFGQAPLPEWTNDQTAVHQVLVRYAGRHRAIKCEDLAALVGMPTRRLQAVIHDLIHIHAIPVGSAMSEPYGYYLAVTPAERAEVARLFHTRALSMLSTERRLLRITKAEMLRRIQLEMEAA